jgi:hypothetical protein
LINSRRRIRFWCPLSGLVAGLSRSFGHPNMSGIGRAAVMSGPLGGSQRG